MGLVGVRGAPPVASCVGSGGSTGEESAQGAAWLLRIARFPHTEIPSRLSYRSLRLTSAMQTRTPTGTHRPSCFVRSYLRGSLFFMICKRFFHLSLRVVLVRPAAASPLSDVTPAGHRRFATEQGEGSGGSSHGSSGSTEVLCDPMCQAIGLLGCLVVTTICFLVQGDNY